MQEYYITISSDGRFNGLISEIHDISKYENKRQVSKEIFDTFTSKFYGMVDYNPLINPSLIDSFINDTTLNKLTIDEMIKKYIIADERKFEYEKILTEEQKDIIFLAEILKNFLEPMMLPSEEEGNKALVRLQEIINRYS